MDNDIEQVIDNEIRKENQKDRSLAVLISWLILLAIIIATCIAFSIKINNTDFKWTEVQRDSNGEVSDVAGYAYFISLPVDAMENLTVVLPIIAAGLFIIRGICLIILMVIQLIAVLVKSRKSKKVISIVTTALSLTSSILIAVSMVITFQVLAYCVVLADIIMQICLLIYVCTWKINQ